MAGNDFDLYALADEIDPAEARRKAATIANAMRQQGNAAVLGTLSPINSMRQAAPQLMKDAWQREQELGTMPRQRLTQALLRDQAAKIEEANLDRTDPAMSDFYGALGRGDDAGMGTAMSRLRPGNALPAATLRERNRASLASDATRRAHDAMTDAYRFQLQQMKDADARDKVDRQNYKDAQNDIIKFSNEIAAERQRATAAGLAAQNIYRSQAAKTLLAGGMVPKQFYEDAAITMARIAGGGGNVGERMADELKAKGLPADVAGMASYLAGRPIDAGMQEWIKLMVQKFNQEENLGEEFIRGGALKQLSRMGRAAQYAPNDLKRVIQQHGLSDYVGDDLLTTYAPAGMGHKVGRSAVEQYRKKLGPGERLAFSPDGRPATLSASEPLPYGWWEPK